MYLVFTVAVVEETYVRTFIGRPYSVPSVWIVLCCVKRVRVRHPKPKHTVITYSKYITLEACDGLKSEHKEGSAQDPRPRDRTEIGFAVAVGVKGNHTYTFGVQFIQLKQVDCFVAFLDNYYGCCYGDGT